MASAKSAASDDERTRARMVRAAAELVQRRGFYGTSVNDVLARARAPRGSLYHHFPGGKAALVVAGIGLASDIFDRQLRDAAEGAVDLAAYMRALAELAGRDLAESGFEAACPVAAAALDAPQNEGAVIAASAACLLRWTETIEQGLARYLARDERHAALVGAALFGATMRARVERDLAPIAVVTAQLAALLTGRDDG